VKVAPFFVCLFLSAPALSAVEAGDGDHPLLDYARERERQREQHVDGSEAYFPRQLANLEHELERARPPEDAQCPGSIGASMFASLHQEVGDAHEDLGHTEEALEAYRHALACRPRNLRIHAQIANVLFAAREFDKSRAILDQALAIDSRDVDLNRLAGNLDFVAERWADALARYRYVAQSDLNLESAAFAQLMFWIAQKRAGVTNPEWVSRRLEESWPRPLVLYAKGEYSEADLVQSIRKTADEPWTGGDSDRQLSSGLFFVAETLWSRGELNLARRYLAAVVTVRQTRTDEYHLAMSEIAKLNQR
jgi:tetratricopeptide (TPR) repeat protein